MPKAGSFAPALRKLLGPVGVSLKTQQRPWKPREDGLARSEPPVAKLDRSELRNGDPGVQLPSESALLEEGALREQVDTLTGFDRESCSAGEARAAELIAEKLGSCGASARMERESVHGGYWWPVGLPVTISAVCAKMPRPVAGLVGGLAAASVAQDISVGSRWFRRLLRRKTTTNVIAEFGDPAATRTVVVCAHHDAARSGLVFHPELPRIPLRRFPLLLRHSHTTPPTMLGAVCGPLLVSLGALLKRPGLRTTGAALSAGYAAAMLNIGTSPVVPGANDNATGVAALLSLGRWLGREQIQGLRVILLSTGSEESFMEGMDAFIRRHGDNLDRETTDFLCLDTVGSPHLLLLEGEGMLAMREYPKQFLRLIKQCADDAGVNFVTGLRFRNATDGSVTLKHGYRTAMIGSCDQYKIPTNYHWPTDVRDNVDFGSVADATRVAQVLIDRLARNETAVK
jgi:hypothetical protein